MPDYFSDLDESISSDSKKYFSDLPEVSKTRSVISAFPKGLIKGATELIEHLPTVMKGPISKSTGEALREKFLPTRGENTERLLERAGELAPLVAGGEGSIPLKLAELGLSTAGGQLAEEGGLGELGQSLAEAAGMSAPSLGRALSKGVRSFIKTPREKLPSGLEKPRAIESKLAEKGRLTPTMQKDAIGRLEKQASKLTEESVKKHVPLQEKIKNEFDFKGNFQKNFGEIKKLAYGSKANVDLTPTVDFLNSARKEFSGIPKPHTSARKALDEIRAFYSRTPRTLDKLYKTYKSNLMKIRESYNKMIREGKPLDEYTRFIEDYNRSIINSITKTFPEDSSFVKLLKETNKDFHDYTNSKFVLDALSPVLDKSNVANSLIKLAENPKRQFALSKKMGQQGAAEIIQIAKDMHEAVNAIKRIPKKDIKIWEKYLPITVLLPLVKLVGIPYTISKGYKFSQIALGRILASASKRGALREALNAIKNNDLNAYRQAAIVLKEREE